MDLTAAEAAEIRFRGTRYAYDRHEVDAFRARVVATLEAYEKTLAETTAKLATLERTHLRGPARRRVVGSPERAVPADPGVSEAFTTWRIRLAADDEINRVLDLANEESRMLRAIARERATEEIEALTETARADALEVTQRAARLANRTEAEAHRRAGQILETATDADEHDIDALNDRIMHLRTSIAAVQERLEALAPPTDEQAGGEVIEVDLRDGADDVETPVEAAPKRPASKKARRGAAARTSSSTKASTKAAPKTKAAAKSKTAAKAAKTRATKHTPEPPSTDEIAAKMAELSARLDAD